MQGCYDRQGVHHGKPFLRKANLDVFSAVYFNRDDVVPAQTGWLCHSQVASTQLWLFSAGESPLPPWSCWRLTCSAEVNPDIAVSMGGLLCTHKDPDGVQCLDPRPTFAPLCVESMCKTHCRVFGFARGNACPRHDSAWQLNQDAMKRADRCNRRAGGQRQRGSHGPYCGQ